MTDADPLHGHERAGQSLYRGTRTRDRDSGGREESSGIATSIVSHAEARATFARLLREGSFNEEEHADIVRSLNEKWPTCERVSITESLARLAGDLAHRYALRGYDSIQLTSAITTRSEHHDLRFFSFDDDLDEAASHTLPVHEA